MIDAWQINLCRKDCVRSLNTQDQVYKCWYCGVSGGVLDFEGKLSGISYNEVREKYFGKRKKPVHPAESLNTHQLRLIGWAEYKRNDRYEFKRNRESVLRDWKTYEHGELVKHFALFMVVAHIENQAERQKNFFNMSFSHVIKHKFICCSIDCWLNI